jgi:hypothetical protein
MLSDTRSVGALLRKCAFLFLALSVFCFGLHARIQAYTTANSNLTASKLSTEKYSAKVLKALENEDAPTKYVDALLLGVFLRGLHSEVEPIPLGELAKIELADPRRLDLSGVYSLHGPPATNL